MQLYFHSDLSAMEIISIDTGILSSLRSLAITRRASFFVRHSLHAVAVVPPAVTVTLYMGDIV